MRRAHLLSLMLLLEGCALEPGGWLTVVLPGTLAARFSTSTERFRDDGWLVTADAYEVQIEQLLVDVSELTLNGTSPSDLAASQRLISLRIGESVPVSVRGTPVGGVQLPDCRPRCGLERGRLTGATVVLSRLRLSGNVRDGSGKGRLAGPTPLSLDLTLPVEPPLPALSQDLMMVLDSSGPERLSLSVLVEISDGLCDGVEWAALPRRGDQLCLGGASVCASSKDSTQVRSNVLRSTLVTELVDAGAE